MDMSISASIYFDFNEPIRTNQTRTKVEVATVLDEVMEGGSLIIWPNPIKDVINIQFYLNSPSNTSLQIYSIDGGIVYNKDLGFLFGGPQNTFFNLSELSCGVYIIRVGTPTEYFVSKVVMKNKH